MSTECNLEQLEFHALGMREVVGRFDGGRITSDAGGLLLREVDKRIGLLDQLAGCFTDHRNPKSIKRNGPGELDTGLSEIFLGLSGRQIGDGLIEVHRIRGASVQSFPPIIGLF